MCDNLFIFFFFNLVAFEHGKRDLQHSGQKQAKAQGHVLLQLRNDEEGPSSDSRLHTWTGKLCVKLSFNIGSTPI